jgi:hypothetical protein
MAHQHEISQQNDNAPYNSRQQELLTRGRMHVGSVVEDAVEHNSRGKSRCEQMCRFPNTGGLHRTPGDAPLETLTLRDPSCSMHEGSVVEDTVERNSRGKSRCEQMCRFPNTGGLHRTSEMHPLKHLICSIQFQCGVMCINQMHHHPNEPKLQQLLTNKVYSMNQ